MNNQPNNNHQLSPVPFDRGGIECAPNQSAQEPASQALTIGRQHTHILDQEQRRKEEQALLNVSAFNNGVEAMVRANQHVVRVNSVRQTQLGKMKHRMLHVVEGGPLFTHAGFAYTEKEGKQMAFLQLIYGKLFDQTAERFEVHESGVQRGAPKVNIPEDCMDESGFKQSFLNNAIHGDGVKSHLNIRSAIGGLIADVFAFRRRIAQVDRRDSPAQMLLIELTCCLYLWKNTEDFTCETLAQIQKWVAFMRVCQTHYEIFPERRYVGLVSDDQRVAHSLNAFLLKLCEQLVGSSAKDGQYPLNCVVPQIAFLLSSKSISDQIQQHLDTIRYAQKTVCEGLAHLVVENFVENKYYQERHNAERKTLMGNVLSLAIKSYLHPDQIAVNGSFFPIYVGHYDEDYCLLYAPEQTGAAASHIYLLKPKPMVNHEDEDGEQPTHAKGQFSASCAPLFFVTDPHSGRIKTDAAGRPVLLPMLGCPDSQDFKTMEKSAFLTVSKAFLVYALSAMYPQKTEEAMHAFRENVNWFANLDHDDYHRRFNQQMDDINRLEKNREASLNQIQGNPALSLESNALVLEIKSQLANVCQERELLLQEHSMYQDLLKKSRPVTELYRKVWAFILENALRMNSQLVLTSSFCLVVDHENKLHCLHGQLIPQERWIKQSVPLLSPNEYPLMMQLFGLICTISSVTHVMGLLRDFIPSMGEWISHTQMREQMIQTLSSAKQLTLKLQQTLARGIEINGDRVSALVHRAKSGSEEHIKRQSCDEKLRAANTYLGRANAIHDEIIGFINVKFETKLQLLKAKYTEFMGSQRQLLLAAHLVLGEPCPLLDQDEPVLSLDHASPVRRHAHRLSGAKSPLRLTYSEDVPQVEAQSVVVLDPKLSAPPVHQQPPASCMPLWWQCVRGLLMLGALALAGWGLTLWASGIVPMVVGLGLFVITLLCHCSIRNFYELDPKTAAPVDPLVPEALRAPVLSPPAAQHEDVHLLAADDSVLNFR